MFGVEAWRDQLLQSRVDVAAERFDGQIRPLCEELRLPAQRRGPDGRADEEVVEPTAVDGDEHVSRRRALRYPADCEIVRHVRRHIFHRVDSGIRLAVEDALVECADERAGLPETTDQLVADAVTVRLDVEQFCVVSSALQPVADCRRLS